MLASGSLSHKLVANEQVGDNQWGQVGSEFNRQMDLRVLDLWRERRYAEFAACFRNIRRSATAKALMVDTHMIFGLLGWDKYEGETEILCPYFPSSGSGQIICEYHLRWRMRRSSAFSRALFLFRPSRGKAASSTSARLGCGLRGAARASRRVGRRGGASPAILHDFANAAPPTLRSPTSSLDKPLIDWGKCFCVGVNYPERNAEYKDGSEAPRYPSLFVRFPESFVGPGEALVVRPKAPSSTTKARS